MSGPSTVELDGTGLELARQLSTASTTIRMWTEFRTEARERLVKMIGTADHATYNGHGVLTVTRTRPRRFDVSAFAADHPDLYESYRVQADEDEVRLTVGKELPEEPAS